MYYLRKKISCALLKYPAVWVTSFKYANEKKKKMTTSVCKFEEYNLEPLHRGNKYVFCRHLFNSVHLKYKVVK